MPYILLKLPTNNLSDDPCSKSQALLHSTAWYVFWLALVLALYWPVLPAIPYRDQPHLMLNHQLAQNDWQWFWSMLSYNRTCILSPGDYFAFRPVHMVVIALQDIFLRYHIVAQGVVNSMMFACAATLFSTLVKRFVGTFAALALTLLWVSQPAGAALVFWQHIAPYILCPALLMLALLILDSSMTSRRKEALAAVCVFLATLTHEAAIATALAISTLAIFFCRRDAARLRQLLYVFCLPVVSSLLLNMADYFIIHPPPFFFGTADTQAHLLEISDTVKFIGAIGTDLFTSPALHLKQSPDDFILWEFYNESPQLLFGMAVPVALLFVIACVVTAKEVKKEGFSHRALCLALLLSFFIAIFAVCAFRMHSRGMFYMAMATYYFGLFALALCGTAACLLVRARKLIIQCIAVIALLLSIANVVTLRTYFQQGEKKRKRFQCVITEGRAILSAEPGLCFSGVIPVSITYGSMFYDVSCANRPGAKPVYIHNDGNNGISLSSALYNSNTTTMRQLQLFPSLKMPSNIGWVTTLAIPYGHDIQFTVNKADNFSITIENQNEMLRTMTIERNLLTTVSQDVAWFKHYNESALDRDSADLLITYKVGFTSERLVLFADGRLIGDLPALPSETSNVNLLLRSTGKSPVEFGNLIISDLPSQGKLQIKPLYRLMK